MLLQLVFIGLQVSDLVTTIIVLALGGSEGNPLVGRFMVGGSLTGLLFAKMLAFAVATAAIMAKKFRVIKVANVVYTGVVLWNLLIIFLLVRQA